MSTSNATLVGMMPVPAGETADFNIHHLTGTQINFIVAYTVTVALAILTLSLRLYTKIFITRAFGIDDALVSLSMMSSVGFFGVSVASMRYGFGRHMWEVQAEQIEGYLKYLVGICVTYIWAPAFAKLSLLFLLHRLNPTRWFRLSLYILGTSIFAYTLTIILIIAFPCSPLKPNTGNCLNKCGLWQAILNIATDIISIALPVHMVYRLRLPLGQKVALGLIFSTSAFVTIICIVRITYIMSLLDNPDVTWTQARAAVWSCVEINVGILCACVIILKPFVRHHFPSVFSSYAKPSADHSGPPLTPRANFFNVLKNEPNSFCLTSIDGMGGDKSVERAMGSADEERALQRDHKGAIVVTSSYHIDSRREGRVIETESTEDMVTPSGMAGSF